MPRRSLLTKRFLAGSGETVRTAFTSFALRPRTRNEAEALESLQRRINRAGWKVESSITDRSESFDDGVAVGRTALQNREQKTVQVPLQRFCPHA